MSTLRVHRVRVLTRLAAAAAVMAMLASGCGSTHVVTGRRVIVLGIDGFDYHLARDLMARGRLPHLSALAATGTFSALATSTPPLSPVAWSTFITGMDPGEHGIFDFIHRDPATLESFLSTSRTVSPSRMLTLGRYQFPLSAGRVDWAHCDPFDRLIAATALEMRLVLLSADTAFDTHPAIRLRRLW